MGDNKIESLLDEAVKELFNEIESEVPDLSLSKDLTELVLETEFVTGKKYYIEDSGPNSLLFIQGVFLEEVSPPPLDENKIKSLYF